MSKIKVDITQCGKVGERDTFWQVLVSVGKRDILLGGCHSNPREANNQKRRLKANLRGKK